MDTADARSIAQVSHALQRDRFGRRVIEHVERVASAVPPGARTTAFLHDALESGNVRLAELRQAGLTAVELAAVQLLTRASTESYEAHVLRVAHAHGPEGSLARCVKLAGVDDHLVHRGGPPETPPYGWARRHIAAARERYDGASDSAPMSPVRPRLTTNAPVAVAAT